jgi:hypothetical protein
MTLREKQVAARPEREKLAELKRYEFNKQQWLKKQNKKLQKEMKRAYKTTKKRLRRLNPELTGAEIDQYLYNEAMKEQKREHRDEFNFTAQPKES